MNQVYLPAARAECRRKARPESCRKNTLQQHPHLVGVLKLSAPVEHKCPAGYSVMVGVRFAKVSRESMDFRQFPDMGGQRVPSFAAARLRSAFTRSSELKIVTVRAAAAEVYFVCYFRTEKLLRALFV